MNKSTMIRSAFVLSLYLGCVLSSNVAITLTPALGETRQWTAEQLFADCTTEGVRLSKHKTHLELVSGTLIEDDGPAAGYSYSPNLETLRGEKQLKKILIVDRSAARTAAVLVAPGGKLTFRLNGKSLEATTARKVGHHWQAYHFDPALLRDGENELIVSGD